MESFEKFSSKNSTKSASHFRSPNLIRLFDLLVVFHFPKLLVEWQTFVDPARSRVNHSLPDLQVVEVNSLKYSQSPADALFSFFGSADSSVYRRS